MVLDAAGTRNRCPVCLRHTGMRSRSRILVARKARRPSAQTPSSFPYLNGQKMVSQRELLGRLGGFIDAVPRALPIAVELRNPWWIDRRYFEFIAEKGLFHVFLQGYFMPAIFEAWKKYGSFIRGSVVIRLYGPVREGIEKQTGESWDLIVAPKDEELSRLVDMMSDMRIAASPST